MKRYFFLLLTAIFLLLSACGEEEALAFAGSGTAQDPYRIETAAQLRAMANLVNAEETHEAYGSAHYLLCGDIELGGSAQWTPIGTAECPFRGVLEGDGHKISGLSIRYRPLLAGENRNRFGLFGEILGGTVRNLTIHNSQFRVECDGSPKTAALVANGRDAVVENCHVTATVSVTASYYAAGICGNLAGKSVLKNCTNEATVSATGQVGVAAGIVVRSDVPVEACVNRGPILSEGDAAGIASTANAGLSDCRNEADVTASNGYAAGIVCRFGDGALNASENDPTVALLRCVNTGNILSASDPAGGIAVRCSTGQLVDCVNEGSVTSPMEAGGIFAYFNPGVFGTPCARFTVTGCRNSGSVSNSADANVYSVGGICGMIYDSDTEFLFENCENSGPITAGDSAGGILGSGDAASLDFLGCLNRGKITGKAVAGGIVGDASPYSREEGRVLSFRAVSCHNEGEIYVRRDALQFGGTILLDSYAGGIAGRCWNLPEEPAFTVLSFENCENTGILTGDDPDTHFHADPLCPDTPFLDR